MRRAAVVAPAGVAPERPLPLLVYLPGWGGSADEVIKAGSGSLQATVVQRMADAWAPATYRCRRWPLAIRRQPVPQFHRHGQIR
jgi:hypothetical protein